MYLIDFFIFHLIYQAEKCIRILHLSSRDCGNVILMRVLFQGYCAMIRVSEGIPESLFVFTGVWDMTPVLSHRYRTCLLSYTEKLERKYCW